MDRSVRCRRPGPRNADHRNHARAGERRHGDDAGTDPHHADDPRRRLIAARALVIGVSTTSYGNGLFPSLPGVALDVRAVANLLQERGFEIRITGPDPSPSVEDVTLDLSTLVEETQPGDLAVIYLAGHGYFTPDRENDEDDRWDEIFLCADGALADDWFREGFWSRAQAGARFVVVIDACHSETATLGQVAALEGLQALGLPAEPIWPQPTPLIVKRGRDFHRLVLAACRDEGETLELVGGDKGGGIVTREMLSVLHDEPGVTYADLWSRVGDELQRLYGDQLPRPPRLIDSGPDDTLPHSAAFRAR